jgi:hypothetical protein
LSGMAQRIVDEDAEAPSKALRTYAVVVLVAALLVRLLAQTAGFLASMCLCGLAPLLVVHCHYHVGPEHEGFRRRFRVVLSTVTALGCAILVSYGGLRVRSLDLGSALVFGVGGGMVTHLMGLIVSGLADLFLKRLRRFVNPQECRTCGYDLTGNTSGTCPECGTSVPLAWCKQAQKMDEP